MSIGDAAVCIALVIGMVIMMMMARDVGVARANAECPALIEFRDGES